jgi:hypothetical protein
MVLLLMKPYYILWTKDKMTDYSLSPMSLVMIFTTPLSSEISLKSFRVIGVLTLGTKVMKEFFTDCMSTTALKKSW